MPIKSYLAHPQDGKKDELIGALSIIDQCDVLPAENENLLIVVTDTETDNEDKTLKEKIEAIKSLELLVLVSGFDTPIND